LLSQSPSAPEAPSIDRCPLAACFHRPRGDPSPCPRRRRLRAGFRRSPPPPREGCAARHPGLITPAGLTDRARRLPTSAITTVPEHDCATDPIPRTPCRRLPSCAALTRAAERLAARGRPGESSPGAGVCLAACRHLPCDCSRGELGPEIGSPGHLLSRARVHAGRSSHAQIQGRIPRTRRRSARERRPHKGSFPRPSAKRGRFHEPEVPSIRAASRRRPLVFHKLSPTCGFPGSAPFSLSRFRVL
jgi:hypothetical protein